MELIPLLVGVFVGCAVLGVVWRLPRAQARRAAAAGVPADKLPGLENEFRRTLLQTVGGMVILVGLYSAWRELEAGKVQQRATQEQIELGRAGQIADRFFRATRQLGEAGAESAFTRIGGAYALEQIARESPAYERPAYEVLHAYLHGNAAWEGPPVDRHVGEPRGDADIGDELPAEAGVASDVQAVLTVLGRWPRGAETPPFDWSGLELRRADLRGAVLDGARLVDAHLEGADLRGASLRTAEMSGAQLQHADLRAVRLDGALLFGANLAQAETATIVQTMEARRRATGEHAFLLGADLTECRGVTLDQAEAAQLDAATRLPWYFTDRDETRAREASRARGEQ
ncbi:MAG TPA: pentapeptide repeat-containing protein [Planctomycetota bacterium]